MGFKSHLLLGLGMLAFAIGAVGLVVPMLPTTIFWIVAAWCFTRSCPHLRDRLYGHPELGRVLSDFLEHGVASRGVKRAALLGMGLGFVISAALIGPRWLILGGVAAVLVAAAVYVATRPEAAR